MLQLAYYLNKRRHDIIIFLKKKGKKSLHYLKKGKIKNI